MNCPHCTFAVDTPNHELGCDAVCVGQWCCGCPDHPPGKPWGVASLAWERHWGDQTDCLDNR